MSNGRMVYQCLVYVLGEKIKLNRYLSQKIWWITNNYLSKLSLNYYYSVGANFFSSFPNHSGMLSVNVFSVFFYNQFGIFFEINWESKSQETTKQHSNILMDLLLLYFSVHLLVIYIYVSLRELKILLVIVIILSPKRI